MKWRLVKHDGLVHVEAIQYRLFPPRPGILYVQNVWEEKQIGKKKYSVNCSPPTRPEQHHSSRSNIDPVSLEVGDLTNSQWGRGFVSLACIFAKNKLVSFTCLVSLRGWFDSRKQFSKIDKSW